MSRLQESDYYDAPELALWESNVRRGVQGKRGQKFLRDLRDILLAMPEKRLISDQWITPQGEICILGVYLLAKDKMLIPEHHADFINDQYEGDEGPDRFASKFNLPRCMCWDIEYTNDNSWVGGGKRDETPEQRYTRMLAYIEKLIVAPAETA